MNEMDLIYKAFGLLANLDIKPSANNVSVLNTVYELLRKAYMELDKKEKAKEEKDGADDGAK